jgi:hypothetical protein
MYRPSSRVSNCPYCNHVRYKQLKESYKKMYEEAIKGQLTMEVRRKLDKRAARRTPNAVFRYFPLIPRLRILWKNKFFSEQLKYGMRSYDRYKHGEEQVEWCTDIHTTPAWDHVVDVLGHDIHNIAFGFSADGARTGTFNRGESITPLCMNVLNYPRHMRGKVDNLLMIGIPPAKTKSFQWFVGKFISICINLLFSTI